MAKSEFHQDSSENNFDPVKQYMDEAGRHELLTAEDEVELARTIEAGRLAAEDLAAKNGDLSEDDKRQLAELVGKGQEAQAAFINANLRLVVKWARVYQNRGLEFLDLIQEGNFGLMRAVEKFEWRKGFKFSTYGSWWIRQFMTRALADKSRNIRLPVYVRDLVIAVEGAESEFIKKRARRPSIEELAEQTGYDADRIKIAKANSADAISLSMPVGEDGAVLGDFVRDEADTEEEVLEGLVQNEQLELIRGYYEYLSPVEQRVMDARYPTNGHPSLILDKIGEELNLTRERVSQIEKKALLKLRSLVHLGRIVTKEELKELLDTA